ncbi:FtsH protease activity modulator HflK [Buchnera aphidicola]|uniref:FtsH protease activity modulator HflK n=1 Tax=Buchnera aphidicola TaxID=9 RepID=UPI0031B6D4E3
MVWKQPINKIFDKDLSVEKKNKKSDVNYIYVKKNNFFKCLFFQNKFVEKNSNLNLNSEKVANKKNNFLFFSLIFFIFFWVMSSFYIVKESEQSVVTNFGRFTYIARPGLNWSPRFISKVFPINIKEVKAFSSTRLVSTIDENILNIKMDVQYKIVNPKNYLFSVSFPENTFKQIANSVVFDTIRNCNTHQILFKQKILIYKKIKNKIRKIIKNHKLGIKILNINFHTVESSNKIKNITSKVFKADQEAEKYISQAKEYFIKKQFYANIKEKKILEEAKEYKKNVLSKAKGEINYFSEIFSMYKKSKEITKLHLYMKSMEEIFAHSKKIFIDTKNSNFLLLLNNFYSNNNNFFKKIIENEKNRLLKNKIFSLNKEKKIKKNGKNLNILKDNILEQRKMNALRKNIFENLREK